MAAKSSAEYKKEEESRVLKARETYKPSEKEIATINRVFERFTRMKEERDRSRRAFDGRTITQYVNDSMDSYNGIASDEIKATKEDWQSLIWDHKTRGKVKTIVAMITGTRPYMSLIGKTQTDHKYARDMAEVYDDSWRRENGSYKLYLQALSAACKGTVVVEEIYSEEKKKIKEIVSVNQTTGQVKFREKEVIKGGMGHVKANIVPLLQFYPNENSAEIEHDCCVVGFFDKETFLGKYGKFPNALVATAGIWGSDIENIAYKSIGQHQEELYEVIRYYNEDIDEFVILANGIWLNKQEDDECSPIPFDHKRLPFTKTVFELADEDEFYGKSLPDLMGGEQDTINAMVRLMVDQEILSINKPVMLGMGIELDSYDLYPGKTVKATGDLDQVKEMDMSGASQSSFSLLNFLETRSDINTSIDPTAQGASSGGRKTARETVILDENAKRISGTFQIFIYKLLKERAELRIANIKQFYRKPLQYNVLKDEYGNSVLSSEGKTYKTTPQYRTIPVVKNGKQPKWVEMTPEMCRINVDIRFEEDFEPSLSRSTRIEIAKMMLDEAKANPLINADETTIDYLEALGKNPEQYYIKPKPQDIELANSTKLPPETPVA